MLQCSRLRYQRELGFDTRKKIQEKEVSGSNREIEIHSIKNVVDAIECNAVHLAPASRI